MKKILVGVDGSDESMKAARMAIDIAGSDGSVTLAYCIVPVPYPPEMAWAPPPDFDAKQMKAGEQVLNTLRQSLTGKSVRVDGIIMRGPAAETLADEAQAKNYDLVVVGTHGYGAMKRLVLGSVANRLVHICKKPTLVVR